MSRVLGGTCCTRLRRIRARSHRTPSLKMRRGCRAIAPGLGFALPGTACLVPQLPGGCVDRSNRCRSVPRCGATWHRASGRRLRRPRHRRTFWRETAQPACSTAWYARQPRREMPGETSVAALDVRGRSSAISETLIVASAEMRRRVPFIGDSCWNTAHSTSQRWRRPCAPGPNVSLSSDVSLCTRTHHPPAPCAVSTDARAALVRDYPHRTVPRGMARHNRANAPQRFRQRNTPVYHTSCSIQRAACNMRSLLLTDIPYDVCTMRCTTHNSDRWIASAATAVAHGRLIVSMVM